MKKNVLFIPAIFLMAVISSCQKDNNAAAPAASNAKANNLSLSSTALCSTGGSQDPSVTIKNGLVGYYPFTGNANDSSGHGNNGTLRDFDDNFISYGLPALTTDKYGHANSAYHFNGLSNYIVFNQNPLFFGPVIPNNDAVGSAISEFSIYLRFKTDSSGTLVYFGDREFTHCKLSVNPNRSVTFNWQSTTYNGNDTTGNYFHTRIDTVRGGPACLDPRKWIDMVITYKQSCLILYLNGILVGFNHTTMPAGNIQNNLTIGALPGTYPLDFFNGSMDEIRFYDRALTNPEIAYLLAH
jgi:hypothetical protein